MTIIKITTEKIEKIDGLIKKHLKENNLPGIVAGVVSGDRVVYKKGFGYRDTAKSLEMTPKTYIGIGSVSKSFTAFGIMNLVNQNKLKLSDPVSKYISYKLGFKETPITIHNLLSHNSGVPELDGTNYILDKVAGSTEKVIPMENYDDFLAHLNNAQSEVYYKPGEHFYYNNDHFTCLALIIEKVTGQKFADYMLNEVLKPLGLNRTTYLKSQIDADVDADCATFYLKSKIANGIGWDEVDFPYLEIMNPAGGLLSSMDDMLKYLTIMLNPENYPDQKIITQNSLKKVWSPVIKIPYANDDVSYCYGFMRNSEFLGETLIDHGGNVIVASAQISLIPKLKLAVYVGSNAGSSVVSQIALSILSLLMKGDTQAYFPFSTEYDKMKTLCGKYETYQGLNQMKVELRDGILYAVIKIDGGTFTYPLVLHDTDRMIFRIAFPLPVNKREFQFFMGVEEIYATYERYVFHKLY